MHANLGKAFLHEFDQFMCFRWCPVLRRYVVLEEDQCQPGLENVKPPDYSNHHRLLQRS